MRSWERGNQQAAEAGDTVSLLQAAELLAADQGR
jgi:hypothetical protein